MFGFGKKEEVKLGENQENIKTITVGEMIDFLSNDEALQNELFGHGLTDEMISQMRKGGISAGIIEGISKKMGLRPFTVNELSELEKSVSTFDTKSYDPYDSETPELKP